MPCSALSCDLQAVAPMWRLILCAYVGITSERVYRFGMYVFAMCESRSKNSYVDVLCFEQPPDLNRVPKAGGQLVLRCCYGSTGRACTNNSWRRRWRRRSANWTVTLNTFQNTLNGGGGAFLFGEQYCFFLKELTGNGLWKIDQPKLINFIGRSIFSQVYFGIFCKRVPLICPQGPKNWNIL